MRDRQSPGQMICRWSAVSATSESNPADSQSPEQRDSLRSAKLL